MLPRQKGTGVLFPEGWAVVVQTHVGCNLISVVYFEDKAVQEAGHTSLCPGAQGRPGTGDTHTFIGGGAALEAGEHGQLPGPHHQGSWALLMSSARHWAQALPAQPDCGHCQAATFLGIAGALRSILVSLDCNPADVPGCKITLGQLTQGPTSPGTPKPLAPHLVPSLSLLW